MEDFAFNRKRWDGGDYKENIVKVMWNLSAKQLQEIYFDNFHIKFDPFCDFAVTRVALFCVASYKLAWRGEEKYAASIKYFVEYNEREQR